MIIKKLIPKTSVIKPPLSKKIKVGLYILQKGEEVGEHTTAKREEAIIILHGQATVFIGGKRQLVKTDEVVYIPQNKKHNIKNDNSEVLKYLYVCSL